jgi:DNA mismatch endonuclease (patch repair protein)
MPKLERNKNRDKEHESTLRTLGWNVLTIWQCEVEAKDRRVLIERLQRFLKD